MGGYIVIRLLLAAMFAILSAASAWIAAHPACIAEQAGLYHAPLRAAVYSLFGLYALCGALVIACVISRFTPLKDFRKRA